MKLDDNPAMDAIAIEEAPSDAFNGKVVVVRGAASESSAGNALARAFGLHGAKLVLVGSSKSRLKNAAASLEESGIEVMVLRHRVEDLASIRESVEAIVQHFGRIDVLVNAILIAKAQLLEDVRPHDLERALQNDLLCPFAWMQACLPHLSQTKGSIISLGSQSAERGVEGLGALAAATRGFAALNSVAAKEWADQGVSTNVVQSAVRNARFDRTREEFHDDAAFGELAASGVELRDSYDELVRLCLALASEEGHGITGRTLRA